MTILSPEQAATQAPACEGSVIVLLLLLLVALLLPGLVQASEPTAPAMSGGIHINEPDLDAWSQALLGAGMNSVQVTAYARQAAWNSADFGFGNQETSDIVVQLQAARRAG